MDISSRIKEFAGLVVCLVITFIAAGIGAAASVDARSFYTQLELPGWAPSPSVFGPVWSILYLMMAISAWLVWRARSFRSARGALLLFLSQLVLNALWSWLFFGWHLGGFAFLDILVLWILIVLTIIGFWRIHRIAGALLLPYLLWVTFAAVLNYSVWQLNLQALG